jgi:hypothetical protein
MASRTLLAGWIEWKNGRDARRSAQDQMPVTGGRRRSKRIDLNFMPPPLEKR